jgi:hypothetical protein
MPSSKEENQNSAQILLKSWGFHNSLPQNVVIFLKSPRILLTMLLAWDLFFNTKMVKFCHHKDHTTADPTDKLLAKTPSEAQNFTCTPLGLNPGAFKDFVM